MIRCKLLFMHPWSRAKTSAEKLLLPANHCKIAIIGFGNMGGAIAAELLRRGCTVCVLDERRLRSKAAHNIIRDMLSPHLSNDALDGLLERFSVACDLEQLLSGGVRIVNEAVDEALAVKQGVFASVAHHFKKHGVSADEVLLCSNTASLPIDHIASGVEAEYRDRCLGLRFLDPVLLVDKVAVTHLDRPPPRILVAHVERVLLGLQLTPMVQAKAQLTPMAQAKGHKAHSKSDGAADPSPDAADRVLVTGPQGQRATGPPPVAEEESRPASAADKTRRWLVESTDYELEHESLDERRRGVASSRADRVRPFAPLRASEAYSALQRTGVFGLLSANELRRLVSAATPLFCAQGRKFGRGPSTLVIVVSGSLRICHQRTALAARVPGASDHFGAEACLKVAAALKTTGGSARSCSESRRDWYICAASTDVTCLLIEPRSLAHVSFEMLSMTLVGRLRASEHE